MVEFFKQRLDQLQDVGAADTIEEIQKNRLLSSTNKKEDFEFYLDQRGVPCGSINGNYKVLEAKKRLQKERVEKEAMKRAHYASSSTSVKDAEIEDEDPEDADDEASAEEATGVFQRPLASSALASSLASSGSSFLISASLTLVELEEKMGSFYRFLLHSLLLQPLLGLEHLITNFHLSIHMAHHAGPDKIRSPLSC